MTRRVGILFASFLLLVSVTAFSTDLRITDSTNTTVVVHDAVIDYGTFSTDNEAQGIRIFQGDAVVTAKWINIQSITVAGIDTTSSPMRVKVDIVTKSGQKTTGQLLLKGKMKLLGKTDLGDYTIDIAKLKSIAPVGTTGGKN